MKQELNLHTEIGKLQELYLDVFDATLPHSAAMEFLIVHGSETCLDVLNAAAESDFEPDEPLAYYRSRLKRQQEKARAGSGHQMKTDAAYETHIKLDNDLLHRNLVTQQEYDERRAAWSSGGCFSRPEGDRMYPEAAANRREHRKRREEWNDYWGAKLRSCQTATDRQAVVRQMMAAAFEGPAGGNTDVSKAVSFGPGGDA